MKKPIMVSYRFYFMFYFQPQCTLLFPFKMANSNLDSEYFKPNWYEEVDKFDNMGLKEEILRGIYGYGFTKPSAIQAKGILPVIQGHDTIAQVSTNLDFETPPASNR